VLYLTSSLIDRTIMRGMSGMVHQRLWSGAHPLSGQACLADVFTAATGAEKLMRNRSFD
jgi:hypothetical protein